MSESVIFLDSTTLAPHIIMPVPDFAHTWQNYPHTAPEQVFQRLQHATIAITNKVVINSEMLAQLPQLKLIAVAATGYNNVDLAACERHGVTVCNVRGYATDTVPEHVFSLILALRRNVFEYRAQLLRGDWEKSPHFCFFNRPIRDLAGSTLGLIGAGNLGRAVGRLGAAFGMRVIYLNQHIRQAPEHGELVSMAQLQAEADVLSLHCPLTNETQNLIDADFIQGMKNTALLINTARGGLVDESALAEALHAGRIAGAGLDVLAQEPSPMSSPMMQAANLPQVIITPHVAWASDNAMQILAAQLVENINAYVCGAAQNVVKYPS